MLPRFQTRGQVPAPGRKNAESACISRRVRHRFRTLFRKVLRSALVIGVSASLLLHVLAVVVMHIAGIEPAPELADEPILVDFDINEAPPPPEAEMPVPEQAQAPAPEPELVQATPEETVPAPEPEPEPEPEGIAVFDAGPAPADAGVPPDAVAPPADAALVAGQNGDGGAAAIAAAADAGAPDAGRLAERAIDAGPAAGTAVAAAAIDTGPGSATATTAPGTPGQPGAGTATAAGTPSTSDVNLLAYLPPGDVVSVMVRFDRLRGWPWAAQAEAILAPMPDYRALIGDRKAALSEIFDFIIISTPQPREVTATTLVGRTRRSNAEMRAFIDQPQAPVSWYAARGGAAGRRLPSPLIVPGDARLFLQPKPSWTVLAQPRYLGVLPQRADGNIDTITASDADLPDWLGRVPAIEEATGTIKERGPVLMVTIQGLLPRRFNAPYVGELRTPRRITLAVEIARGGFYVRGAMLFDTDAQAEAFIASIGKARTDLTASPLGKALLRRFHIYHALNGLTFQRNGTKVAYATSISVADARGLLDRAAAEVRAFFAPQPEPDAPQPETPRAPRPQKPAEPPPQKPAEPPPQPAEPQPQKPAEPQPPAQPPPASSAAPP
jgi:hypothetical protein